MQKKYYILNKPFGTLCQFTGESGDALLGALYPFPKDVYSVGRLDKDSEGLLILTNDNKFKTKVLDPSQKTTKTYYVQVDGAITENAIKTLKNGSIIIKHNKKAHKVKPANCAELHNFSIQERKPPVRKRATIPTSWITLEITEGKNRQVRKMTAAVNFPTLRLIRMKIGKLSLENLLPGEVKEIDLKTALKALE